MVLHTYEQLENHYSNFTCQKDRFKFFLMTARFGNSITIK